MLAARVGEPPLIIAHVLLAPQAGECAWCKNRQNKPPPPKGASVKAGS